MQSQTIIEPIEWTPHPRKDYHIIANGVKDGIGLLPYWRWIPGAWNLLWLCSDVLDGLLPWKGDITKFPKITMEVGEAVGFALQPFVDGLLVGQVADRFSPQEFVAILEQHPARDTYIPALKTGENPWQMMYKKAEMFRQPVKAKILRVNFGR